MPKRQILGPSQQKPSPRYPIQRPGGSIDAPFWSPTPKVQGAYLLRIFHSHAVSGVVGPGAASIVNPLPFAKDGHRKEDYIGAYVRKRRHSRVVSSVCGGYFQNRSGRDEASCKIMMSSSRSTEGNASQVVRGAAKPFNPTQMMNCTSHNLTSLGVSYCVILARHLHLIDSLVSTSEQINQVVSHDDNASPGRPTAGHVRSTR